MLPPSLLVSLSREWHPFGPTAAVEQAQLHMLLPSGLYLPHREGALVDPQMRASNEHLPSVRVPRAGGRPGCPPHPSDRAASASKKDGLATPFPLFAKSWKRFVKPGAPGPLSLETLVALKMAGLRSLSE
jgi:hypothetical protein